MAKEIVTLNIEDTCLRLMVVKDKEVRLAVSQPLEAGLVKNGTVVDRQKLSQAIGDLFQSHGVANGKVVMAISGINAFYRLISQPPVPSDMLAEAAKREAERVMPVPLSELHLSYQVLSSSKIESVLGLVGLPRIPTEAQVETLRMAGLNPYVMDIKPLALVRAVSEPEAIFIEVQEATFDIVLMVDGLPQIIRSLSFPRSSLPWPEKVTAITEELDRTVKFYNSAHKDRPLKTTVALFVSGEIDGQGEELLRQRLGYESRSLPEPPFAVDGLDLRRYLVNLGLALKVADRTNHGGVNINVLPEKYLPKKRPLAQVLAVAFLPLALAGSIGVNMLVDNARDDTRALEAKLAQTQAAVQLRQKEVAQFQELEQTTAALAPLAESWQRVLADLTQDRVKVSKQMNQAAALAGESIRLDAIKYGPESTLTIQGVAPSKDGVLSYAQRLKDTRIFSETLVKSVQDKSGAVEFTLELK